MEWRWLEKIKEMGNEELLRETERKGSRAITTAEEILSRISEKKIAEEEKYLEAILENIRVSESPRTQEAAKRVINETAKLVKERRYLNEKNLSNILRKAEPFIKEQVGRTWLDKEKVSNYSLREIIRDVPSLRNEAGERLLKQSPNHEDFYVIEIVCEGEVQMKAFEKDWEENRVPIEDACSLIELVEPLAITTWQKLQKEDRIKEIETEDLVEIFNHTSYFEIKQEAIEGLWFERKEELFERFKREGEVGKEVLELIMDNAEMIRGENPQRIREEAGEMLYMKRLSLEENLKTKERVTSLELKLKYAKKALQMIDEEIGEIKREKEKWEWLNDHKRKRLEELKKLQKELKIEIEEL